jgi:RimJ/RimL family protein N-acetyltransferase
MKDVYLFNEEFQLKYRQAIIEDLQQYFLWRNDESVVNLSYNKNLISLKNHSDWFKNKISDKACVMLIFFNSDNQAIGQVRIETNSISLEGIISVSLDNKFRGQKLGYKIIKIAADYFNNEFKIKILRAFIFKINISSIESFKKAGFKFLEEKVINGIPSVVLEKND